MQFLTPKFIADDILDAAVTTAKINDDAITLAKMAGGTDGNVITFDASGNPAAVATGSAGNILTSAGAGQPPTFAAAAASGKLVQVKLATGSGSASTASTGTSATEIFSTTFTPTSDSNSLIISYTGGGNYGSAENGESRVYITSHLKRVFTQVIRLPMNRPLNDQNITWPEWYRRPRRVRRNKR